MRLWSPGRGFRNEADCICHGRIQEPQPRCLASSGQLQEFVPERASFSRKAGCLNPFFFRLIHLPNAWPIICEKICSKEYLKNHAYSSDYDKEPNDSLKPILPDEAKHFRCDQDTKNRPRKQPKANLQDAQIQKPEFPHQGKLR